MIRIASMVGAPDLETPTLATHRGDLAEACSQLHELGFDGIELMIRRPADLDDDTIRQSLAGANIALVALCTGHVFAEDHLGLVTPEVEISQEAYARLLEFVQAASRWIGPGGMVNIGRARGLGDPLRPAESLDCLREALQQLADDAAPHAIRLTLEPVSKTETSFVHSTQDGLEMVRRVNRPNLGLILDTYHMYREDADPLASLREAREVLWHVHISDANRRWPGSDAIPFEQVVETLQDIRYDGYLGLEIQPWPEPLVAAQQSILNLRKWIGASNDRRKTWQ